MRKAILLVALLLAIAAPVPVPAQELQSPEQKVPWVTPLTYNRLEVGMEYKKVLKLMGRLPNAHTASAPFGVETIVCTWHNPDDTLISVVFQEGRLASKSGVLKPSR